MHIFCIQTIKAFKMTQHGGKRSGAGRKPGAVSKAKRELADMAKDKAGRALEVLAEIMERSESDAARVSAANAILDRGYGKPSQAMQIGTDPDNPLPPTLIRIEAAVVDSDDPTTA